MMVRTGKHKDSYGRLDRQGNPMRDSQFGHGQAAWVVQYTWHGTWVRRCHLIIL